MGGIKTLPLEAGGGEPFTLNDGEYLYLHFDGCHIQSAMNLKDPFKLCFSYVQAMMGFKLFHPAPDKILIVGLGGGSLSKYCFKRFPSAKIKTIEISPEVIALRDTFYVPQNDARFEVELADAVSYLANIKTAKDVILLDAYGACGLPDALCTSQFYQDCHDALDSDGILVVNLVQSDPRIFQLIHRLANIFDHNCLITYVEDCGNYILIAGKTQRRLTDGIANDIQRLKIKVKSDIWIPYFDTLHRFYETRWASQA